MSWNQGWMALGLLAAMFAAAPAQARDQAADQAAIRQVVEDFRKAIIAKDKPAYMALFFSDKPQDIGWQAVSEDTRLEHIRQAKPDAIKARKLADNNFIALIDSAVATKEPREETIDDLRIETDGEIASVSFEYSFLAKGVKTNWGREMWQLLRTEAGWKIYSVVYTIRDQHSREAAAATVPPPAGIVDYLVEAAAKDFHEHPPGPGLKLREVLVGHLTDEADLRHYRLCGEFQVTKDGVPEAWRHFATLKTSAYEQWIGGDSEQHCKGAAFQWEPGPDLAPRIQQRLDALSK